MGGTVAAHVPNIPKPPPNTLMPENDEPPVRTPPLPPGVWSDVESVHSDEPPVRVPPPPPGEWSDMESVHSYGAGIADSPYLSPSHSVVEMEEVPRGPPELHLEDSPDLRPVDIVYEVPAVTDSFPGFRHPFSAAYYLHSHGLSPGFDGDVGDMSITTDDNFLTPGVAHPIDPGPIRP
jgi:hypothetical protein